jgi:hypothetical protein
MIPSFWSSLSIFSAKALLEVTPTAKEGVGIVEFDKNPLPLLVGAMAPKEPIFGVVVPGSPFCLGTCSDEVIVLLENEVIPVPLNEFGIDSGENGRKVFELPCMPVDDALPNGLLGKGADGAPKTLEDVFDTPFVDIFLGLIPGVVPNMAAPGWEAAPKGL